MARLMLSKMIEAPRESVFAEFSDFRTVADRLSGVKRCEVLTDGPIRAGTRYRETREMMGKEATEEMEITVFDPPSMYRVEGFSCGARWICDLKFSESAGGTLVEMEFSSRAETLMGKLMSPLGFLMKGAMRKCIEGDLNDLKAHIESGRPVVAAG